jgi:hypothetical protein
LKEEKERERKRARDAGGGSTLGVLSSLFTARHNTAPSLKHSTIFGSFLPPSHPNYTPTSTCRGVLERMPNARLAIVGAGPAEAELHEYFKGTKTVFTGLLHGRELSEAFASADVFLMPSDSETLGFVILESMASGVPVVGANAGGIPNVIDHGTTGFLVPVGDDAAFTQRVEQLLGDPMLLQRMRQAGRDEAERLDWGSAMAHLRNVHYKRAVLNFRSRLNLRGRITEGYAKLKSSVTVGVQGLFATAT